MAVIRTLTAQLHGHRSRCGGECLHQHRPPPPPDRSCTALARIATPQLPLCPSRVRHRRWSSRRPSLTPAPPRRAPAARVPSSTMILYRCNPRGWARTDTGRTLRLLVVSARASDPQQTRVTAVVWTDPLGRPPAAGWVYSAARARSVSWTSGTTCSRSTMRRWYQSWAPCLVMPSAAQRVRGTLGCRRATRRRASRGHAAPRCCWWCRCRVWCRTGPGLR